MKKYGPLMPFPVHTHFKVVSRVHVFGVLYLHRQHHLELASHNDPSKKSSYMPLDINFTCSLLYSLENILSK